MTTTLDGTRGELVLFFIPQNHNEGMAQWWERSPPTNVARVRFLDPASYVGWVCCWFSTLLRGFFSGYSGFPLSTKINTSKFQFDLERVDEEPPRGNATANSLLLLLLLFTRSVRVKYVVCSPTRVALNLTELQQSTVWRSFHSLLHSLAAKKFLEELEEHRAEY